MKKISKLRKQILQGLSRCFIGSRGLLRWATLWSDRIKYIARHHALVNRPGDE